MYYVYILYSADLARYYVGMSADPDRRLAEHLRGKVISTRKAKDWVRVAVIEVPSTERKDALALEVGVRRRQDIRTQERIERVDLKQIIRDTHLAARVYK